MRATRNKYIGLILIGLTVFVAGFTLAHLIGATPQPKEVHSIHSLKYKDAVIAARLHQNHFKRHRFHLYGLLPVQQDTVTPIVTGAYTVAPVQDPHVPASATPSLRGPPVA
jgi:hypothetical protein